MRQLSKLPKAPARFLVVDWKLWLGWPLLWYGIIRRLAHEQRKRQTGPYLRILFGEAGRRGDPWGGLTLEINGELFHFGAGIKRWPEFHDGNGNLTAAGKQALGHGLPGHLSDSIDWRWVQDEVDLSWKTGFRSKVEIASYFRGLRNNSIALPKFQSRSWARRYKQAMLPGHHNCTTIILEQLRLASSINVEQGMPLPAFNTLVHLAGKKRTPADNELNYFLSLPEAAIESQLRELATGHDEPDWNLLAKGVIPIPDWLNWSSLKLP